MAYCTLIDIKAGMDEEEIIRYTDDYDAGVINTDATEKAIAGADAMINSLIAKKYAVPVSPVPDIILGLAVDIAIYKIYSRRSQAPDEIRKKYDDAIRYLDKVAAGKAVIPDATGAATDASANQVTLTSNTRIFTRSTMDGF